MIRSKFIKGEEKNSLFTRRNSFTLGLFACALLVHTGINADDKIVPNLQSGEEMYKAVCHGCHGVSIAPTLRGIINRPIASVESFKGYSEGIKEKQGMMWTKENLNVFLTDPLKFAPGTLMIQIIPEEQKRADIIAFLGKLPPPRK